MLTVPQAGILELLGELGCLRKRHIGQFAAVSMEIHSRLPSGTRRAYAGAARHDGESAGG